MTASFFFRRIVYGLLLMLGVVVLNFLLIRLAPGDPAVVVAGETGGIDEAMLAVIRADYGLDKPLLTQLWIYLANVAQGNLGESFFSTNPLPP